MEVLVWLQESGQAVLRDRWSEHLVRAVRHAQLAGRAEVLEMLQRTRSWRQHGALIPVVGVFPVAGAFPVLSGKRRGGKQGDSRKDVAAFEVRQWTFPTIRRDRYDG